MNVPEVVQALRMITEFSAVSWSPIQFWFGPYPNNVDERIERQDLADAVEQPERRDDEDPQDRDGRRAGDRREVVGAAEERLAADLLVDDDRQEEPDRHRQGDPHQRVVERVLDGPLEDRVGQRVGVVRQPAEIDRPGADVPAPQADVQGVEHGADLEHQEQQHRHRDHGVAGERLRPARAGACVGGAPRGRPAGRRPSWRSWAAAPALGYRAASALSMAALVASTTGPAS